MSFARELGFAIQQASKNHGADQGLCEKLGITLHDVQKLYKGRLFLTGSDLDKVAELCEVSAETLIDADSADYDAHIVHCMTEFKNRENKELILDLIDAYIDAKEALAKSNC